MCSLAVELLLRHLCGAIGGGMRCAIFLTLLPLACYCHDSDFLKYGTIRGREVSYKEALGGQVPEKPQPSDDDGSKISKVDHELSLIF